MPRLLLALVVGLVAGQTLPSPINNELSDEGEDNVAASLALLKDQLAAAYRLVDRFGWTEVRRVVALFFNVCSARGVCSSSGVN